jgi:hypothetical protein
MPAIPAGVTWVKVHVVDSPLLIVAGTGAQVPFTVPSSTISTEELDATDAEEATDALEKLIAAELEETIVDAEEVTEALLGSVTPALEEDSSGTVLFALAEHFASAAQAAVASSTRPA